ncbi:hypothetical protein BH10ACI4_BH10ACI4_17840 [soil metagenome]
MSPVAVVLNPSRAAAEVDDGRGKARAALRGTKGQRAVVVQSGARDAYQLALALSERDMLEMLVTDLFWPLDQGWARSLLRMLPRSVRSMILLRSERRLPWRSIKLCWPSGLRTLLLEKFAKASLDTRRQAMRQADAVLGQTAGSFAKQRNVGLVSYSYYGYDAFSAYGKAGILFQLHPHPESMRKILSAELSAHPDCADSLSQEWELSLPDEDFQHLVQETRMAAYFLVASSFTKATLIENGARSSTISVIPYGVDTGRFRPNPNLRSKTNGRLRLLFVGRINQRKGIKYLLEALSLVNRNEIELTVCGRVVDGLELFGPFSDCVQVRPSVSADELVAAYQTADLFVFPSVAEGFGQVLLESLACGLPILSTTHTAAPDLIEEGVQGFVVEPRRPDLLAGKIIWALEHRSELAQMGQAARSRAEEFTWERFRSKVADSVEEFLIQQTPSKSGWHDV